MKSQIVLVLFFGLISLFSTSAAAFDFNVIQFCETYEDDCERDNGDEGVGPDGPIDDGEDDRDGGGWDDYDGL